MPQIGPEHAHGNPQLARSLAGRKGAPIFGALAAGVYGLRPMGSRPQHATAYRQLCAMLKSMREDAGLSQRALSARLGRVVTFASKVEAGTRRIDPIELASWCKACGVDPSKAFSRLLSEWRIPEN